MKKLLKPFRKIIKPANPARAPSKKVLRNQRGVALLITLFAIMIMIFLAVEIGFNTTVELKVGAAQVDRLKAYYLAKTGVQLSLLRINIYKTVLAKFGANLGPAKSQLDMIWQFPFAWPPTLPEDDISSLDREKLKEVVKKSYIDGAFSTTIEGESTKIDINDLDSPAKTLRDSTYAQIVQMIQNRLDADDDWAQQHRDVKPTEIVNNIADWIDADNDGRNGSDEKSLYVGTDPAIVPANRPMKTLDELHMVAGMTDDIFNILAPRLTVYGSKGINVNLCSKDVLRSIDKQITSEIADEVIKRRSDQEQGGPFGSADDFGKFIQTKGVRIDTFNKNPQIPLFFDSEFNFRIKSSGIYGRAQREIVAVVYDFDKVKAALAGIIASASPSGSPSASPSPQGGVASSASPSASPASSAAPANGQPAIVYWQEY